MQHFNSERFAAQTSWAAAHLLSLAIDVRRAGNGAKSLPAGTSCSKDTPPSVLPRIARKRRTTCLVGRLEAAQKSAGSKRQPWPTGVTKREVEFLCQSIQGTGYDWVFTSNTVCRRV